MILNYICFSQRKQFKKNHQDFFLEMPLLYSRISALICKRSADCLKDFSDGASHYQIQDATKSHKIILNSNKIQACCVIRLAFKYKDDRCSIFTKSTKMQQYSYRLITKTSKYVIYIYIYIYIQAYTSAMHRKTIILEMSVLISQTLASKWSTNTICT